MADTLQSVVVLKALDVNIKSTGSPKATFIGARTGKKFMPLFVRTRIKTNAIVTANNDCDFSITTSTETVLGESSLLLGDGDIGRIASFVPDDLVVGMETAMVLNITGAETATGACTVDFFLVGIYLPS